MICFTTIFLCIGSGLDSDDFDISLDDYTEHPAIRRAPAGGARARGRETEEDRTGMDHLTLEFDASDLSAEVTARLRAE